MQEDAFIIIDVILMCNILLLSDLGISTLVNVEESLHVDTITLIICIYINIYIYIYIKIIPQIALLLFYITQNINYSLH